MTFTRNIYPFSHLFLKKSVRLNYFLAASVYFCELDRFNHDIALFLRPYGGLIGSRQVSKSTKKFTFARYLTRRRSFRNRFI